MPLTALGSLTVHVDRGSAGELRRAEAGPLSATVLRTFDPAHRAGLTTDACNLAVAAILTLVVLNLG